jgi:predicted nucleotidyltransferase
MKQYALSATFILQSFWVSILEKINFVSMMLQIDIENKLKALKPTLSERYFIDKIGYFGSFARNEQNDNSDIDIIVSFNKPLGWAFFDLQEFLELELGRKVDLVSSKALKDQLKNIILREVKYI